MAKQEHVAKLKEGVEAWNDWRQKNADLEPDLSKADLSEANLSEADLFKANLSEANLSGVNLNLANLVHANLSEANLIDAKLNRAILVGANLRQANLSGAQLIDTNLFAAELHGVYLNGADLTEANLMKADLTEAKLCRTDLSRADLTEAKLIDANLSEANLSEAKLSGANLRHADLHGASLEKTALVGTNLETAVLSDSYVYGISAWDVNVQGTIQSNLVITPRDQPQIRVDNLQVAQFIYLLLNRQELRSVITTIGEKAVLILGRFTERKELLDQMANKLRSLGYLPMIFDFERPTDRDITETVKILAGLSRFVIADITNPRSVPLELQAVVPDYMVPFVTILQRGQPAFGMFDDLPRKYHWALPLLEYNSGDTLLATFEQKVVSPALEKAQEVRIQKAAAPVRRSAED